MIINKENTISRMTRCSLVRYSIGIGEGIPEMEDNKCCGYPDPDSSGPDEQCTHCEVFLAYGEEQ